MLKVSNALSWELGMAQTNCIDVIVRFILYVSLNFRSLVLLPLHSQGEAPPKEMNNARSQRVGFVDSECQLFQDRQANGLNLGCFGE
eukprot:586538-Amphidinium_carterae.1